MKRFITLLFVALVSAIGMNISAEVITQEIAKQTAENFLSLDNEWQGGGSEASIRLVEEDGMPAYYIIEYSAGGWIIVSAQSSSNPVIGYNTTDKYEEPEPMQAVLKANARRIVETARISAETEHEGWQRTMQRKPANDKVDMPDIAPLITMDLNQRDPYNSKCPSIDGKKVLVGCVAVGMAQAMMVQRYPAKPQGKHTYTCAGIGTLSIDYDQEPEYDWDAMFASETTKNYDEVARLLYHCGVSVDMKYGLDGSGTYDDPVPDALIKNFCYDPTYIQLVSRPNDDRAWLETLLNDIYLGRVIIYFGANDESGHCWNIDGWKNATQMVHVNWGWGGTGNGYYNISDMQDKYQGMSFPYSNTAILGVGTPTTAPYGIKLSTTKFVQGTAAGVALADVIVSCEDSDAVLEYEILGPKNILGKHSASPYSVQDGKLVSDKTIEDANAFKYMLMTVTNTATGESFQKEFTINVVTTGIENVLSDAMRVYPSVTTDNLVVEVPVAGGEYAVYAVSGAQVSAGNLSQYKTTIDVSQLVAGTYILRYVHSDGVGVKTFIKK